MFVMTLRCRYFTGGGRLMPMMEYILGVNNCIGGHLNVPDSTTMCVQQLSQDDDGRCFLVTAHGYIVAEMRSY